MPHADPKFRAEYERKRKAEKYKRFNVIFPLTDVEDLERKAANNDVPVATYLRLLIIRDLKAHGAIPQDAEEK